MENNKAELVFFPLPIVGHITPMVELAKRLVQRDSRISITILIYDIPQFRNNSSIQSLHSHPDFISKRIKFLELPNLENPLSNSAGTSGVHEKVKHYAPVVRRVVEEQVVGSDSAGQLVGFVLDFFATPIMDVATQLNVSSYIFFATNASLLNLALHFQHLQDYKGMDSTQFTDPNTELEIPGFLLPVPCKVLPGRLLQHGYPRETMLNHTRRYRSANGILINTFEEIESHALSILSDDPSVPMVYPVGPIVNVDVPINESQGGEKDLIMKWLDEQPQKSVVFLCFGSIGSFPEDQVKEIAKGLEGSEHRFLWSLRRPLKQEEKSRIDHEDQPTDLPDGFLERTVDRGRVIGWAPQVAVLSHPAVGGFVSHCGWNSTLESLWFGVPIATWPIYAEQQTNAFLLVKELGLAVEIRMDYRSDPLWKASNDLVEAEAIEKRIRQLMDADNGDMRSKVEEISTLCKNATKEGGSSYASLGRFVEDVLDVIEN